MLTRLPMIHSNYMIETDDDRLVFVSEEMRPIHQIYFQDIVYEYKRNNALSDKLEKKYLSDPVPQETRIMQYDNTTAGKHKKNKGINLNELRLDQEGNITTTNKQINCNVVDFLTSSFVFKNIHISSRLYIFNHFVSLPQIHLTKEISIPIVAFEIHIQDILTKENKQILKTNLNTRNISVCKMDLNVLKTVFSSVVQTITPFKDKVRSICSLVENETNIYCNLEFVKKKNLLALPGDTFKNIIILNEISIVYKTIIFTSAIALLTFFGVKLFLKRHYKNIKHLMSLKNFDLFTAVYDSRNVLIKRYKKTDLRVINELQILSLNLSHNIIKYNLKITHFRSVDLIFSKPMTTLREYIKDQYKKIHGNKDNNRIYFNDTETFNKLLNSLNTLHNAGIIYNNLSPDNIFIERGEVLFSNFEDACLFQGGKCLIQPRDFEDVGMKGYRSPEILNKTLNFKNFEECKASDRFSLSVIIYEMVYNSHPFNNYLDIKNPDSYWDKIEENIKTRSGFLKWRVNISLHDLISNAIMETPRVRYSTDRFNKHPFFWAEGKVFDFIANISDIVEKGDRLGKGILSIIEAHQSRVFIQRWNIYLDINIINKLEEARLYNYSSLRSLIRAIRNGGRHYNDNSEELINVYSSFPKGYVSYYVKKFPYLLTTLYYSCVVIKDHVLLQEYYPTGLFRDRSPIKLKTNTISRKRSSFYNPVKGHARGPSASE
ncbi:Serine/threonine-protein kinase/endoribonuclease IRE2 [Cucumispora dikerogammari]|nr:Serine/threonine-protein kinase/endoribonuclease IRE2 [Cucumispora dikerogammari]